MFTVSIYPTPLSTLARQDLSLFTSYFFTTSSTSGRREESQINHPLSKLCYRPTAIFSNFFRSSPNYHLPRLSPSSSLFPSPYSLRSNWVSFGMALHWSCFLIVLEPAVHSCTFFSILLTKIHLFTNKWCRFPKFTFTGIHSLLTCIL